MIVAGKLGRLFAAQGVVGAMLAVLANGADRPAAAWVLAFLGGVLLSTGVLLWALSNDAVETERRAAWTERNARWLAKGRGD